jgi:hypothetical protein
MATAILPTGNAGKTREARRQTRDIWAQLEPNTWNNLTATQRWEIVRRVFVFILRNEFPNLD